MKIATRPGGYELHTKGRSKTKGIIKRHGKQIGPDVMIQAALARGYWDDAGSGEVEKVRRVRTPAGAKKYGQPIGSIIAPDVPGARAIKRTVRQVASRPKRKPTQLELSRPATAADRAWLYEHHGYRVPPGYQGFNVMPDFKTTKTLLGIGFDAKGRPQRIYTAEFRKSRDAQKFKRIQSFDKVSSKLDKSLAQNAKTSPDAAAVLIMRRMGLRPGSDTDTKAEAKAYGATNMLAKHVTISKGKARFQFVGKEGVEIDLETDDPDIIAALRIHKRGKKPGDRLFDTTDKKTNDYIKEYTPGFTNKDLRTYLATNLAAMLVKTIKPTDNSKRAYQKARNEVAKIVSAQLGNRPKQALDSYINPIVFTQEWGEMPS